MFIVFLVARSCESMPFQSLHRSDLFGCKVSLVASPSVCQCVLHNRERAIHTILLHIFCIFCMSTKSCSSLFFCFSRCPFPWVKDLQIAPWKALWRFWDSLSVTPSCLWSSDARWWFRCSGRDFPFCCARAPTFSIPPSTRKSLRNLCRPHSSSLLGVLKCTIWKA